MSSPAAAALGGEAADRDARAVAGESASRPGRHNLTAPLDSFVGREAEQAYVKHLLGRARLVTLTGAGGTGKTRLAQQVAADALADFADGVFWVGLAPLSRHGLVAATIAETLGVKEVPPRPLIETLKEALGDQSMLLVLDSFEHVVKEAPCVSELLAACPRLTVLATSREVLRLVGEHEFSVPPLAAPHPDRLPTVERLGQYPAIRLFVERARAAEAGFDLTPQNAPAVARICARLDGLPLAIELAAARIRLLSPPALLARLTDRLGFLKGGPQNTLPRHKTLRAAIDWSYELLTEPEQALFRLLGLFVGGFTCDAAAALDPYLGLDVLEGMSSLINKSLLRRLETTEPEPRFAMLDTLREYAHEQLKANGELPAMQQRHASFFLGLAEQAEPALTGPEQVAWLDRLEQEHDDIRAALRWCAETGDDETALRLGGALWRFWSTRGYLSEGRQWLESALARSAAVPPTARAKALNGAGNLAREMRDYQPAAALLQESVTLWREQGVTRGVAEALNNLGLVALYQTDHPTAARCCEEGLALFRQLGDKGGIAAALNNLGNLARNRGEQERATKLCLESLTLRREVGDKRGIALSLNSLAQVALNAGDLRRAAALHEESLALRRELGDRAGVAASLNSLAHVAQARRDYQGARARYEESLRVRRELGDKAGVAVTLNNVWSLAREAGDRDRAAAFLKEALNLRRELGDQQGVESVLGNLRALARDQTDAAARAYWEELLTIRRAQSDRAGLAAALQGLGSVARAQEDYQAARDCFAENLKVRREMGDRRGTLLGLNSLGDTLLGLDQPQAAADLFQESVGLARETGDRRGLAAALHGRGRAQRARGERAAAQASLTECLSLAQQLGERRRAGEIEQLLAALKTEARQLEPPPANPEPNRPEPEARRPEPPTRPEAPASRPAPPPSPPDPPPGPAASGGRPGGAGVRVFLSSTWQDMRPERQAVEQALRRLQDAEFIGMEYFGSRPETPLAASLAEVDRSDVYVGLFGQRYGSGITEAEYRRARERDLPCLIFVQADPPPEGTAAAPEDGDRAAKQAALKRELKKAHVVTTFADPDKLALDVVAALHNLLRGRLPPPPPPTVEPARPRHNLPAELSSLIGRERETREVRARLRLPDTRLLTMTGAGGVGKSRLALEAAAGIASTFPDGAWFVPLAPVDRLGLAAAVAQALGVREDPTRPLVEALREYLRDKRLLLLLDNCEHVLGEAGLLAAELLAAAPGLTILATSRESLRVRGGQEYPVPPLGLPDLSALPPPAELVRVPSVRLFADRARAVKPSFALTAASAPAVAEICHRLDGLPLALELAAAQADVYSPQEIADGLRRRVLEVLVGGPVDPPAHHGTMRATIAWSDHLLVPEEHQLFRRLGVFVGGFTLEAVQAVCDVAGDLERVASQGVVALVRKSLLRRVDEVGEARFELAGVIRDYALERLAASHEEDAVRTRHADYYTGLAEQAAPRLGGKEQSTWLARLDREQDNLRAALRWLVERKDAEGALRLAGALWRFWWARGRRDEGRQRLAEALALPGADAPAAGRARAHALLGSGALATLPHEAGLARPPLQESLELYRALDDRAGTAWALQFLGQASIGPDDNAAARAMLEESQALGTALGEPAIVAGAVFGLGLVTRRKGDFDGARALLQQSQRLWSGLGDQVNAAAALRQTGTLANLQGDLGSARALLEQSLAMFREAGDLWSLVAVHGDLGEVATAQGDYPGARRIYQAGLALARELGHRQAIANLLSGFAYVVAEERDFAGARQLLEEALAIRRETDVPVRVAWSLAGFAFLAAARGQPRRAVVLAGAAAALRQAAGSQYQSSALLKLDRRLGPARKALGEANAAAAWARGQAMSPQAAIDYALADGDG